MVGGPSAKCVGESCMLDENAASTISSASRREIMLQRMISYPVLWSPPQGGTWIMAGKGTGILNAHFQRSRVNWFLTVAHQGKEQCFKSLNKRISYSLSLLPSGKWFASEADKPQGLVIQCPLALGPASALLWPLYTRILGYLGAASTL